MATVRSTVELVNVMFGFMELTKTSILRFKCIELTSLCDNAMKTITFGRLGSLCSSESKAGRTTSEYLIIE